MSIKYFCDLCNTEVAKSYFLTTLTLDRIEDDLMKEFNRSDIDSLQGWNKDICINCRATLVNTISNPLNFPMVKS